ncbi:hypothetical protein AK812_SmicGene44991, partial [Symbiodinium microadriaticum]
MKRVAETPLDVIEEDAKDSHDPVIPDEVEMGLQDDDAEPRVADMDVE